MPQIKTKEDVFCMEQTMEHKQYVKKLMFEIASMIKERGEKHDNTKLEEPEFSLFSKHTPRLAKLTYGSPEYKQALEDLKPALIHHYANSRHHTEHFANGIKDMNLVDIMEMFIDWYCASKRHDDGNIRKSIVINKERFGYSDDLERIFENSIELIDK